MLEDLDWKFWLAIFTTILVIIGYIPYFKDIFLKKTKPHLYTWLIWAITQGTATAALLYGGGNFGVLGLITGTVLVVIIFGLSFKYGTRNITRSDTIALIVALLAIFVWFQLDNPLLSVFMVSAIDGLGYLPTFRKTWEEPYSETIFFWVIMAVASVLIMISNAEYNLLTMTYLTVLAIGNTLVVIISLMRRKMVQNSLL